MIPSQPSPDLNETNWIVRVNESVRHMPSRNDEDRHWKKRSIYRVPACITDLNQKAYWPQAVSIGPYHHGKDDLLPMEEHKHRALLHFLWRSGMQVEPFLNSLRAVEQDLKDSYHMLDPKWEKSGGEGAVGPFLQLMITDGCFMLEILRSWTLPPQDYPLNDPIFSEQGRFYVQPYIKRDMLMLENQLPMLVLDRLVAVESDGQKGHEYINSLILRFYHNSMHMARIGICLHVLDVLWKSLLLQENMPDSLQPDLDFLVRREWGDQMIQSATELNKAEIRLKKSKIRSLKNISFAHGVLSLPAIMVNDITESMFLNLMMFECFRFGASNEVTAYIFFMDSIINTEEDVALLRTKGIIQNFLGSNKEVVELFNSLTKDMTLFVDNCGESVQQKINEYCHDRWNKWRANLIHNYFGNPWAKVNLIAAVFLFFLTIVQTVYTVLGYHK